MDRCHILQYSDAQSKWIYIRIHHNDGINVVCHSLYTRTDPGKEVFTWNRNLSLLTRMQHLSSMCIYSARASDHAAIW